MSGFGRQRLNAVSGSDSEYDSSSRASSVSQYDSDSNLSIVPKKKLGFGAKRASETDDSASNSDSENSIPPNSSFGAKKKKGKGKFRITVSHHSDKI